MGEPMLTRFLKNARGGVAPLKSVVAVPVMGAVGIAVDYSRVMLPALLFIPFVVQALCRVKPVLLQVPPRVRQLLMQPSNTARARRSVPTRPSCGSLNSRRAALANKKPGSQEPGFAFQYA